MRKILLVAMLLTSLGMWAQVGVAPRPDCDFGFNYTVTGGVITSTSSFSPNRLPVSQAGPGIGGVNQIIGWDNRISICTNWTVLYQSEGVGALSLELDQAPSVSGQPGSWSTWVLTSPGFVWPITTLTVGQGSSFGYQPWVSVNLNSATGTGTVYGRVFGWRSAPGQSGVGVQSVAGGSTPGTVETTNPVPSGVVESQSSFIQYLCGYLNSADGRTVSTANCANIATALFNGTTYDRNFYCPNTSTFSVASTVTQVVALSGATKVRVCSYSLNPSTITAGSVDIVYGTGSNCGTGTTTLTGAYTLPASAVIAIPGSLGPNGPLITPAGQAVCVRTVTSTANGFITWAQY